MVIHGSILSGLKETTKWFNYEWDNLKTNPKRVELLNPIALIQYAF
jgi:hypothetical protein